MPSADPERYREDLLSLVGRFEFVVCEECGRDVNEHVFAPDMFGKPHAYCTVPDAADEPTSR